MGEVIDRSPDDCDHEKTLLTIDTGDGEYEQVCVLCNDIETITLDNE